MQDWSIKNIQNADVYLELSQKPRMKIFHRHSQRRKKANYLCKIASRQAFDRALNVPNELKIV